VTRSTAVLLLRGREYPLDLEGLAWFDPQSGAIAKISAGLETSMEDVGLRELSRPPFSRQFRPAQNAARRAFCEFSRAGNTITFPGCFRVPNSLI
jgi:hypothetical protein